MSKPLDLEPALKSYYVGDPAAGRRGQDKHHQVHCLVWTMILKVGESSFTPAPYMALSAGGSTIGRAETVADGRRQLFEFTKAQLQNMKAKAEDEVRRCQKALDILGDDPAHMEKFDGTYKRRP